VNKWRNWDPTRGPGIAPSVSKIFKILNLSKSVFSLGAGWTVTLMTSGEKGENGVFWEQLEELGPTKGA
jgi:hypothetical protein